MEFDTRIPLKATGTLDVASDLPLEAFHERLWKLFQSRCAQVGDGPGGECWLDYSAPLRTRHLTVGIDPYETGRYRLRFSGGSKPDYLCDVVIMLLVLAAFWCLSKLLVPAPPAVYVIGCIAACAAAAGLYFWSGKRFGEKETALLEEAIREAFSQPGAPSEKA